MTTKWLNRSIFALMPIFWFFLAISAHAQAPSIITQPASQSSAVGGTIQFTVSAAGGGTLVYQWQKNTTNLANGTFSGRATVSGATTASVTLAGITTNDQANYTCRVTNTYGSVTSSIATLTVYVAPTITTQPVGKTNPPGANVSFIVVATGTAPLSYQWMENGTNIPSATLNVYSLDNVTASDTGTYSVSVSNPAGTVNSSNAPLVVEAPPVITGQPLGSTNLVGGTAALNATATGDALTYQWKQNGTKVPGATNASYSITNIQTAAAGTYTVTVTNLTGSITSAGATLWVVAPLIITVQPASQTAGVGSNVVLSVVASDGSPPLYYQWFNSTNLLASATDAILALNDAQLADSGSYYVVITNGYTVVTSAVGILSVQNFAPNIITQPVGGNEAVGDNFTFMVTATGTSLSYQWQKNGANIANATGPCLALSNLGLGDAGNFTVIVTNSVGSVTSTPAILEVGYPPAITTNPVSQTNAFGGTAVLSCTATGPQPMNYQWFQNSTNLIGQTNATLTLTNLQLTNVGNYYAIVGDAFGSITSSIVALHLSPGIAVQPTNQVVMPGTPASFMAVAGGEPSLSYQWQLNGTNLADNSIYSGSISNTLNLAAALTNTQGNYIVVVSNSYGSITSAVATLSYGFQAVSTFNYSGVVQTYIVPAGVTQLGLSVIGGNGASSAGLGGEGGSAIGIISVNISNVLQLSVGGGGQSGIGGNSPLAGYNGGNGPAGGGAASIVAMPDGGYII
ncbi:MAG TPA: immunoglobulin domain-containing protein, partial [Candidatus Saccharimonadales bacterium]|nr:immunoglobulin domain-containing protein [Candidatus Saccharimonadales bacterium]